LKFILSFDFTPAMRIIAATLACELTVNVFVGHGLVEQLENHAQVVAVDEALSNGVNRKTLTYLGRTLRTHTPGSFLLFACFCRTPG
jgi:hypothetical protein